VYQGGLGIRGDYIKGRGVYQGGSDIRGGGIPRGLGIRGREGFGLTKVIKANPG
jgi:hypothetical protein